MKRLIVIAVLIVLTLGTLVVVYMYNKPHVNVRKEKVDFNVSVDSIVGEFEFDQGKATLKYMDKIIQLSGKFDSKSSANGGLVTLVIKGENSFANCEMDSLYSNKIPLLHSNDNITVKGLFVGYDDLLGELQLKKCLFVK